MSQSLLRARTPMIVAMLLSLMTTLVAVIAPPALAQEAPLPSDPDLTFGGKGTIVIPAPNGSNGILNVAAVVPEADGGSIVVGTAQLISEVNHRDVLLARLRPDGALDTAWGTDGYVLTDVGSHVFGGPTGTSELASSATVDPAGRIIVVGSYGTSSLNTVRDRLFAIAFGADGAVVDAFDGEGTAFSATLSDGGVIRPTGTAMDAVGRLVIAGSAFVTTDEDVFVMRLAAARAGLALDNTFGVGGVTTTAVRDVLLEAGPHDAVGGLDIDHAGRILVVGSSAWDTSPGQEQADQTVLRYLDNGTLDGTFGGGAVSFTYSENDFGRGVLVDPTGGADAEITVIGDIGHDVGSTSPVITMTRVATTGTVLSRLPGVGETGPTFEPETDARVFAVTRSAFGLPIVLGAAASLVQDPNGTSPVADHGIARFDPAGPDVAFAPVDGAITVPCGEWYDGSSGPAATAGVTQPDGKYLIAGACGSEAMVVRLWGDHVPEAAPAAVSDLAVTATASAPAGRERTPLSGLDALAALSGNEAPLQAAPLRNTPLRNTPLRNTPLRNTPLRNTPLRNTPLRNTTLAPIMLSDVPLRNTSWSTVLAGSPFDGVPLQTVTLDDVFALPDADTRLAGITLEMIDLADTPLRNTTLTGLLLGSLTLAELPTPTGGWCAFLHDGGACPSDIDPATTLLFEIEIRGYDLSAYYAQPLMLGGRPLAGSVLGEVLLDDVRIADTPYGVVDAAAVAAVLTCGSTCTGSFADAQAAGQVDPTATVAELIALGPVGSVADVSLGQLLVGMLPLESLPFEDLPLNVILDNAELRSADLLTYTASFNVDCPQLSSVVGRVVPDSGARLVTGAVKVSPTTVSAELTAPTEKDGPYGLTFAGTCVGTQLIELTFAGEPPVTLGDTAGTLLELSADGFVTTLSASSNGYRSTARTSDDGSTLQTSYLYTGHLGEAGDVDHFLIPAPDPGSRLTVSLSHLPADYDLVLYGPDPDDPATAPLRNTPLRNTPLRNTPLRNTPLRNTGLADGSDEPGTDGQTSAPDRLQDVPLRNTPLRNTSINTGTETESVSTLVRGSDQGGTFTVQVSGFNGASSADPYVLRVTTTPRPTPLTCVARPYVGGTPGTLPDPAADHSAVETIILVNQQRLQAAYPNDDVAGLMTKITALAAHQNVKGLVLPVDGDVDVQKAYVGWDETPCSLDAANGVVDNINQVVDRYIPGMPQLRHLVLVGGDEMLPQARVPDLTTVGNQVEYTEDLRFDLKDNPVSSAARDSHVLTDDPYGDLDPQAWLDGQLYVPDVALGRLVESPTEIDGAIQSFLDANGFLDPQTSFVAGYDFLTDGATEVREALDPNGTGAHRIDEAWTASDATTGITAGQFASVNAHYDHYQGLPALTHAGGAPDLFSAGQLAQDLSGSVLFTMGCNAGLSVADIFVSTPAAGDWAQVASARGALFTGNTGFGYGDTEFVAYSEALMAEYARNLASGQMTAGQALMYAKQAHVAMLGVPGVYDAKAMEESTFYGLPMYRIGAGGGMASPALPIVLPAATAPELATSDVTVAPFGTGTPQPLTDERGQYWTAPGETPQISHFRPVQPRTSIDVTPTDGLVARGAVLEGLTSMDVLGVDPVYATPTIDLGANEPEADITDTVFPTRLQTITSHPTPDGWKDRLVLMAGQFATEAADGTGRQRLFTEMSATVYRSDSGDFVPPAISNVEGTVADGTAMFQVTTPDTDVFRAVVLYLLPGETVWRKVELAPTGNGTWAALADIGTGTVVPQFLVQLVDEAGNVGSTINKSLGYRATEIQAAPGEAAAPIAFTPGMPAEGYFTSDPSVTMGSGDPAGPAYEYRIDGGAWMTYSGPFALTGTGDAIHRVEVRGSDGSSGQAWVPVDRSAPVVTVLYPTPTTKVVRNSPARTEVVCADAVSGVQTCPDGASLDTSVLGARTVDLTATDAAGRSTTVTVSYEVVTHEYRFDGFYEPIANGAENVVKAGQAVPVKFRLFDGDTIVDDVSRITTSLSGATSCNATQSENAVTETVPATADGGLKWDAAEQQFVFVHKTHKSWKDCRTLTFTITHPDQTTMTRSVVFRYTR